MKGVESTCVQYFWKYNVGSPYLYYFLLLMRACVHVDNGLSMWVCTVGGAYLSVSQSVKWLLPACESKQQLHAGCMCKRAFFPRLPALKAFQQHLQWRESEVGCHAHNQRHACMRRMKTKEKNNNYYHRAPKPAACWWTAGSQCACSLLKAIINFWSATVLTTYIQIEYLCA